MERLRTFSPDGTSRVVLASLAVLLAVAVYGSAEAPSDGVKEDAGPRTLAPPVAPAALEGVVPIWAEEAEAVRRRGGGGLAGFEPFFSGFEPPCDTGLNGNGYIGGGGSGLPQNCDWHASNSAQSTYRQPHIDDVNPLTDLQHLRFQYDPNQPSTPSARNWAFNDDIVPAPDEGVAHLSLDLYISATGGLNTYVLQPQSSTQLLRTTVMHFLPDGTISVGDDNDCSDDNFGLVGTGVSWTAGQYVRVDICVDTINDRIRYFYDGNMIYSTGAGEGGIGGPLGCGVFAGTIIEHVLIKYESNFNDGTIMDVDNVTIEEGNCPEPTGACCNFDGQGGCDILTETQCGSTQGTYAGNASACDGPFCEAVLACEGAAGGCFEEAGNGTPGCDDPDCCVQICVDVDPFCCEEEWDEECASNARDTCVFLTCQHSGASCQAISTSNASTSVEDGTAQVADNFTPAAGGNVNSICFYGAYLPADLPNIGDDGFTVRYYDCADGVPTNVIAQFTQGVDLTITDKHVTNLLAAETANIFEYTATHPDVPVSQGEVYFLEIVNSGLPSPTSWFWEWGLAGDGVSYQKVGGLEYARYFRDDTDLAFCLNVELAGVGDLCPVPDPQPCALDVAGADVQEGESCGADPDENSGCTADGPPFVYTDLAGVSIDPADPTVIHGEAWADAGSRDVDWYRFTAPGGVDDNGDGEVIVCLSVASELPMAAVVVTDPPPDECVGEVMSNLDAVGFECGALLEVVYPIADQSEQLVFARASDGLELFGDYPCAGPTFGSDYLVELAVVDTGEECFPVADTCPWDLTGDGFVGINDLLVLLAAWGPAPGNPADFNGDGTVGINDLLALLANWGNCP
ncbi:MAG: hypothetical protein ACYS0G_09590 [Planctomycetota bacterium]|jgi:hypothetical protein